MFVVATMILSILAVDNKFQILYEYAAFMHSLHLQYLLCSNHQRKEGVLHDIHQIPSKYYDNVPIKHTNTLKYCMINVNSYILAHNITLYK